MLKDSDKRCWWTIPTSSAIMDFGNARGNFATILAFVVVVLAVQQWGSVQQAFNDVLDSTIHELHMAVEVQSRHRRQKLMQWNVQYAILCYVYRGEKRKRKQRRVYVLPKSPTWSDVYVLTKWNTKQWKSLTRVSQEHFDILVNLVRPYVVKGKTNFVKIPVSTERKVAATLLRLAEGCSFVVIIKLLGFGEATCCIAVREVCAAIVLADFKRLEYPSGAALKKVMDDFEKLHGWKGVAGAIDCTYIKIRRPFGEDGGCYHDRMGDYGIILQAVVDSKCRFLDVYAGWPGSVHDARVFRASPLYVAHVHKTHVLATTHVRLDNGELIKPYLLGDAGYQLMPWVITPYDKVMCQRDAISRKFNFEHSSQRMSVERTFGVLKNVWRLFSGVDRCLKHDIKVVTVIVMAGCILHNWLIDVHETNVEEYDLLEPQPGGGERESHDENVEAGSIVRDCLRDTFCGVSRV